MKACPTCKTLLAEAVPVGNSVPPRAGDVTICGACGSVLQFSEELGTGRLVLIPWPRSVKLPEEILGLVGEAMRLAHANATHPLDVNDLKHDAWKRRTK